VRHALAVVALPHASVHGSMRQRLEPRCADEAKRLRRRGDLDFEAAREQRSHEHRRVDRRDAIVEGGPSERRRFLDWGVFHVEPGYLEAWKSYRRVLSQRNAALKRLATSAELRPWSVALVAAGAAVDDSRLRYLDRLAPFVTTYGQRLLDRPLSLDYRRGWAAEQSLDEVLAAAEEAFAEIERTR